MLRYFFVCTTIFASLGFCFTATSYADEIFNSQLEFLAAAGSVMTETFENAPNIGTPGGGGEEMIVFDYFSATSAIPALKIFDSPMSGNFNTTTGGAKYFAIDTDIGHTGSAVTLTFEDSLWAFGLFLIDPEEDYTILINGVDFTVPETGNGTSTYFGIITDTSFSDVEISGVVGADSFSSFDDVSFAAVPEPSSLFVFGFAAGATLVRRQKRSPIGT